MPREFPRTRRVAEQIRRELVELIRDEVRDPRASMASMTSVTVSRDLAHARVYITYLGDPAERGEVIASLNQAAGALRRELGRRMHIRAVPRLEFCYDEVVEKGARLSSLITAAVSADSARHAVDADDEPVD